MRTSFVDGMYFWIYDLEDDNTFERDPEQLEQLKKVIRLRRFWLETFGKGIFRDTVGLADLPTDARCPVRRYELDDGCLIAAANGTDSEQRVTVLTDHPMQATAYTAACTDGFILDSEETDQGIILTLPRNEYAVIRLIQS